MLVSGFSINMSWCGPGALSGVYIRGSLWLVRAVACLQYFTDCQLLLFACRFLPYSNSSSSLSKLIFTSLYTAFPSPAFYFISAFLFLLKIFFCFMHPSDVDWSARNGRQNSLCHFLRPRCHGAHIRSGRCSWRRKKQILHRGKTKGTA